jgi:hypothetical protein
MIVCNLPDSGHGAGGWVEVATASGLSNKRVLSICSIFIDVGEFTWFHSGPYRIGNDLWYVNWRVDLNKRVSTSNIIRFEASKPSVGMIFFEPPGFVTWADSSESKKNSISLFGEMDLSTDSIYITTAMLRSDSPYKQRMVIYNPRKLKYDSSGIIWGYTESSNNWSAPYFDSISGSILFPPSPKDGVRYSSDNTSDGITIQSSIENSSLLIYSQKILGSTITSLYSIDGRLLRRETIEINSPGEYRFNIDCHASDVGILVLSTQSGLITKKVIF